VARHSGEHLAKGVVVVVVGGYDSMQFSFTVRWPCFFFFFFFSFRM
jgi:hypothetical protein